MKSRTAGSRSPGWAVDAIAREIALHPEWNESQVIHQALGDPIQAISESTARRIYKANRSADSSPPWSVHASSPEDARLVLDLIPVVSRVRGREWWPSGLVAEWIVRIRRAFPDFADLEDVLYLASRAAMSPDDARRVVSALAYRPWLDEGHALVQAVAENLVPHEVAAVAGYGPEATEAYQEARHPERGRRDREIGGVLYRNSTMAEVERFRKGGTR